MPQIHPPAARPAAAPESPHEGLPQSLVHLLYARAQANPHRRIYAFAHTVDDLTELTLGDLLEQAQRLAATLHRQAKPGDRALLLYPPGLGFIVAFFACLMAGLVPVPAYPPRPRRGAKLPNALLPILKSAAPTLVLGPESLKEVVTELIDETSAAWLSTDGPLSSASEDLPLPKADDLALLQYTSGSTGQPRGVMLTHRQLLSNLETIRLAFGTSELSIGVFWLPFYHDMGLIGGVLETLYCGGQATFMAPMSFLMRPGDWLTLISRLGATISGAPNFAYEECVARLDAEDRQQLDLSPWRLAFCGAEFIHPATLTAFAHTFAEAGFRASSLYPCYGLAEATLMVAGRAGVKADGQEEARGDVAPGAGQRTLCGEAAPGMRITIVEPSSGEVVPKGDVGEIWVSGPSVGLGYWGDADATQATFKATLAGGETQPWLRTGDLGRWVSGEGRDELVIMGRLKDVIIVGGINHHPDDIEAVAKASHPALAGHRCAAFAVTVEREERLVLITEADRSVADQRAVLSALRRAVGEAFDLPVHDVQLVLPRSLPTTSSGKVRRRACRDAWLGGALRSLPQRRKSAPQAAAPGRQP